MSEQSEQAIPRSIGIIMDGNRRYAKARNMPIIEGHRRGYAKLREVLQWAQAADIRNVIVYAFSAENWRRTKEEVENLMDLLRGGINEVARDAKTHNTRIIFLGERERLPQDIIVAMARVEDETRHAERYKLGIALSYGGRAEILRAIAALPEKTHQTLTEEEFAKYLWTKDFPDPDLIIRTGGEQRLSGFLLWQAAYSELFFTDTLWPDFTKEEFNRILEAYATRERRFGA